MYGPMAMDQDGYYHPSSEEELIELVKWAFQRGLQLRVRGSGHTFPARAIFTDGDPGKQTQDVNLMLDRYRGVRWIDEENGIVEVDAGCNLGINPGDPTKTSTLANSLFYQMQETPTLHKKWALSDLGGITHQTISGFLSTGSSGGSLKYGIEENILKLRIIDGAGEVHEITRDEDPDLFHAAGVSMGLLGVISKVTLRCVEPYNLKGSEATTTYQDCEIDLFGPGNAKKPSLEKFLRDTDYSRLMWWPQRGVERIVVWKAHRIPDSPDFERKPYEELGDAPQTTEVFAGLLLSILGNLDNLHELPQKIQPIFKHIDDEFMAGIPIMLKEMGVPDILTRSLASFISALMVAVREGQGLIEFPGIHLLAGLLERFKPEILPSILKSFVQLDSEKTPPGPQTFQDTWWQGLPMDNGINDDLMPTWFTEIWLPISKTREVMSELRAYFDKGGLAATGTFSVELYGARENPFWMSPSSDGEAMVRVDFFWFGYNDGDPTSFYDQFWDLLAKYNFKLHWGKYLPKDPAPAKRWAAYFAERYKHWHDFLALRAKLDPKNIFLTSYWREHLGLEEAKPKRYAPSKLPQWNPFVTYEWSIASRWARVYSVLILLAVAVGLIAAHVPFIIGTPWTTCQKQWSPLGCALTFHYLEVPIVCYQIYFAIYGLYKLRSHANPYTTLLGFTVPLLALFSLFEVILILESFRRGAPEWEIAALFVVASMLMSGVALGLFVRLKLKRALTPPPMRFES
ncbi:MAG TPA: FAD-binding protein [Polyangiaceae bacterium]|nr:FAD-binding protein [Polyangiaceae bacterium]